MRWWGFAVGLFCLMLSVPAGAMTIVRASDESLVEQAPLVVVGRVVAAGPAASGAAAREYRVDVERVLKGDVGPALTVQVPGGMGANGIGRRIYGVPAFSSGERTILFLEPGPDGAFRLLHLVQGAFREVRHEGVSLALRDLREVTEMRLDGGAVASAPASTGEPARDFDAFARWIGETARGRAVSPDYRVATPATSGGLGRISAPFGLFTDDKDGLGIRWFNFDSGGNVRWHFGTGGQPGVPGGGQNEFKTAIQAWHVAQTSIRYAFAGVSGAAGGLDSHDNSNVLLLNDPNGELDNLSALCAGTLAYGGPWYTAATRFFKGQHFHEIVNADIVINDGLQCFFDDSDSPGKAAEELFAHELGHTLAIDHTNVGDALMAPTIHDDGRGARLHNDDRNAARALYPTAGSSPPPSTLPPAPTNLAVAPLSTEEILLTWQDNANNETGFVVEASLLGGTFVALEPPMPANTTEATVFGLMPATGYLFRVKAINASGSSAYTAEAQASTNALPGACFPGAQTLCLSGGRFRVEVDWETSQATSGAGQVVPGATSDDSGLFYFFQASNWEMLVKVLAACPVNERFWVFLAATTDVEYFVTVTDTTTTAVRTYFNPQGTTAQTVTDNAAFATCP